MKSVICMAFILIVGCLGCTKEVLITNEPIQVGGNYEVVSLKSERSLLTNTISLSINGNEGLQDVDFNLINFDGTVFSEIDSNSLLILESSTASESYETTKIEGTTNIEVNISDNGVFTFTAPINITQFSAVEFEDGDETTDNNIPFNSYNFNFTSPYTNEQALNAQVLRILHGPLIGIYTVNETDNGDLRLTHINESTEVLEGEAFRATTENITLTLRRK